MSTSVLGWVLVVPLARRMCVELVLAGPTPVTGVRAVGGAEGKALLTLAW